MYNSYQLNNYGDTSLMSQYFQRSANRQLQRNNLFDNPNVANAIPTYTEPTVNSDRFANYRNAGGWNNVVSSGNFGTILGNISSGDIGSIFNSSNTAQTTPTPGQTSSNTQNTGGADLLGKVQTGMNMYSSAKSMFGSGSAGASGASSGAASGGAAGGAMGAAKGGAISAIGGLVSGIGTSMEDRANQQRRNDYDGRLRGSSTSAVGGSTLSGMGQGAAIGASVGGPWGAVIGGVVGGVGGLLTGSNKRKRAQRRARVNAEINANTVRPQRGLTQGNYIYAKQGAIIPDGNMIVEVERGEPIMTPDRNIAMVSKSAPTHNQGGVKLALEPGTMILGDDIIPGTKETFKQRGETIARNVSKWENRLSKSNNQIGIDTANRMLDRFKGEFESLAKMQEGMNEQIETRKFRRGGILYARKGLTVPEEYDITSITNRNVDIDVNQAKELGQRLQKRIKSGVKYGIGPDGRLGVSIQSLFDTDDEYLRFMGTDNNNYLGVDGYLMIDEKAIGDLVSGRTPSGMSGANAIVSTIPLKAANEIQRPKQLDRRIISRGDIPQADVTKDTLRQDGRQTVPASAYTETWDYNKVLDYARNNQGVIGDERTINGQPYRQITLPSDSEFYSNPQLGGRSYYVPSGDFNQQFPEYGIDEATVTAPAVPQVGPVDVTDTGTNLGLTHNQLNFNPGLNPSLVAANMPRSTAGGNVPIETAVQNAAVSGTNVITPPVTPSAPLSVQRNELNAQNVGDSAQNLQQNANTLKRAQNMASKTPQGLVDSVDTSGGDSGLNDRLNANYRHPGFNLGNITNWGDPAMLYNLGMGLFSSPERVDDNRYYNWEKRRALDLMNNRYNEAPELERIATQSRVAAMTARAMGGSHAQNQAINAAAQASASRAYGEVYGRKNLFDASQRQASAQMLANIGAQESAARMTTDEINAANRAQKQNFMSTAMGQASQMLQRNQLQRNQQQRDTMYTIPASMAAVSSVPEPYRSTIQGNLMNEYNTMTMTPRERRALRKSQRQNTR